MIVTVAGDGGSISTLSSVPADRTTRNRSSTSNRLSSFIGIETLLSMLKSPTRNVSVEFGGVKSLVLAVVPIATTL